MELVWHKHRECNIAVFVQYLCKERRMSMIPVKIRILDREYTLRVNETNKVRVQQASQALSETLKQKQHQMNIIDKQDLLSFVAFDILFERINQQDALNNSQVCLEKLTDLITESVKSDVNMD